MTPEEKCLLFATRFDCICRQLQRSGHFINVSPANATANYGMGSKVTKSWVGMLDLPNSHTWKMHPQASAVFPLVAMVDGRPKISYSIGTKTMHHHPLKALSLYGNFSELSAFVQGFNSNTGYIDIWGPLRRESWYFNLGRYFLSLYGGYNMSYSFPEFLERHLAKLA